MCEENGPRVSGKRRIVLIDKNEIVGAALREYLENSGYRLIEVLRSIEDMDMNAYDIVLLNLSYYQNHKEVVNVIKRALNYDIDQLIVFSDMCLYKCCPELGSERVTVLCKKGVWNFGGLKSKVNSAGLRCGQQCSGFQAVESDIAKVADEELEFQSGRENEVLGLVGRGFSSEEIASKLYISKRTVDHHRESILRKLNLSGMSQLVALAVYFVNSFIE